MVPQVFAHTCEAPDHIKQPADGWTQRQWSAPREPSFGFFARPLEPAFARRQVDRPPTMAATGATRGGM